MLSLGGGGLHVPGKDPLEGQVLLLNLDGCFCSPTTRRALKCVWCLREDVFYFILS